ncbi:MAG TPA: sigma-54 dependent transcriptional regulator [Candidatus Polarisedimenticolia bacterium]|nr:sigma-54 dependent transcriptional regulator [Candidatus Polarisedimenticolia bacterium]
MPTILIVDDERNIRATVGRALRLEGYTTEEAEHGAAALERLESGDIDLVIVDLQMPVLDGFGFLERMAERGWRPPAIVLTAHGSIEKAVKAVRLGAFDFIEKPPSSEHLILAVGHALRFEGLREENRRLKSEAWLDGKIVGTSAPWRELEATIGRVAPSEATVLIQGENGSGKEVVARALHAGSQRRQRPLVTVNCAALPETLFESELFGHAKGAFTGATEARRGRFQAADGGTLFLDEIGEVPLPLQAKLLRSIETGEVERVGGRGPERVNVRLIAATNRDLEKETRAGRFRQDLYYRLLVVPIQVPSLRERRDDIPEMAAQFLTAACRRHRARPKRLLPEAVARLAAHDWPGNVRELRNAMERVAILCPDEKVGAQALAFLGTVAAASSAEAAASKSAAATTATGPAPTTLADALETHERELILRALERHRYRMTRAAAELGLERSHLYKKMKALGIEKPSED